MNLHLEKLENLINLIKRVGAMIMGLGGNHIMK